MISIKSDREIALMREAGKRNMEVFKELAPHIKAGITTKKLDEIVYKKIIELDCVPVTLGYEGYPASVCISINDEVVHGIPGKRVIQNGDVVKVDLVLSYKGYCADATRMFTVGDVSDEVRKMIQDTKDAFYAGVSVIKEGTRVHEIGQAIEDYAHSHGLSVVEELCGHGIGANMHEEPDVTNFNDGNMTRLKAGMTIAVEPMLNLGKKDVYFTDDEWTVKTKDGKPSAHYENTILVTKDGYEILTGD